MTGSSGKIRHVIGEPFKGDLIEISDTGTLDTLPKMFKNRVQRYQGRVALRYKKYGIWQEISWKEYYERVKHFGLGLLSLGFKEGDTLAILSEDRPEWLFADLGSVSISGISVGVYPSNSPQQCEYIVDHSESKFWVVENEEQLDKALEVRDNLPNLSKLIVIETRHITKYLQDPMLITFDEVTGRGRELDEKEPLLFGQKIEATDPDSVANLVYTSGTSGPPKGAMNTHRNIIASAKLSHQRTGLTDNVNVLCYLPLCHAAERAVSYYNAINVGYTVNFAESMDTVPINLREVSPTSVLCVPRMWEKFHSQATYDIQEAPWYKRKTYFWALKVGEKVAPLRLAKKPIPFFLRCKYFIADLLVYRRIKDLLGLKRAKFIFTGAAPIAPDILRYFQSINCFICEGYGSTESAASATLTHPDRIKLGTVGEVAAGMEMKIADDGEILIKGPNVFKGYFKDPELTKETIVDGWLHTGDIGEFDDEKYLRILDRKKDIIITAGGKNITPQYIENLLKFSPYIEDAVVIGDKRKYLVALIVIEEENCTKFAQENRIPFSTYADLSRNPQINRLIQGEVSRVNERLARVETIKKFAIFDKRLRQEDEEITPTMKIKRKIISEKHKELIESLYS